MAATCWTLLWDEEVIVDVATLWAQMEGDLADTLLGQVWTIAKRWTSEGWAKRAEQLLREAAVPLWSEVNRWGPVRPDLPAREQRQVYKKAVRAGLEAAAVTSWAREAAAVRLAHKIPLLQLQGMPIEAGSLFPYDESAGGVLAELRDWHALRLGWEKTENAEDKSCALCGSHRWGMVHVLGECSGTVESRKAFAHELGDSRWQAWRSSGAPGALGALSLDHPQEELQACVRYGAAVARLLRAANQ